MPRRNYALHLGTGSALTTLKTANTLHIKCSLSFISISIWYPRQNSITAAGITQLSFPRQLWLSPSLLQRVR